MKPELVDYIMTEILEYCENKCALYQIGECLCEECPLFNIEGKILDEVFDDE